MLNYQKCWLSLYINLIFCVNISGEKKIFFWLKQKLYLILPVSIKKYLTATRFETKII